MKKEKAQKQKDEDAEKAAIKLREERIHLHAEAQKKAKNKDRAALRGRIMDFDDDFVAPVHPKEEADIAFLDKALGSNFIFSFHDRNVKYCDTIVRIYDRITFFAIWK